MPYYVRSTTEGYWNPSTIFEVVVMPPGSAGGPGTALIDSETAVACNLSHGQRLNAAQVNALREGRVQEYHAVSGVPSRPAGNTGEVPAYARPAGTPATYAPRSPARMRASKVAAVVEFFSWLFLIGSVIVGIVIAADSRPNFFDGSSTHPYVGQGIAVALTGAFWALVVMMFATYIRSRTE